MTAVQEALSQRGFATRIINLIQSDLGRPVGHIVSNLVDYNRLVEDLQTVLDILIPKEMTRIAPLFLDVSPVNIFC